jgi:phosphate transport system substrate-binding protein
MVRKTSGRWRGLLAGAVIAALALAACGGDDDDTTSDTTSAGGSTAASSDIDYSTLSGTLNGSGSSFQAAYDEAAIAGFAEEAPDVTVNYGAGGSGKGKQDLADGVVDYAGTDSLVKPEDLPKYDAGGGLLYFPTVAAPITVSYNLDGVDDLNLDADVLAGIFQGTITKWDDDAIAALNDGADLPDTAIVAAHRSDGSGTTSNFTKYLAAAAPDTWTLGSGDTVEWPSGGQAGNGNPGVAQIIKDTDGAIGYVDLADAETSELRTANIKNAAGEFVAPTLEGASAAVEGATIEADLTYSPLNAEGAEAYPITSPTWIIIYKNQSDATKGNAVKGFLSYILGPGQELANDAGYANLPDSLIEQAQAQLGQIVISG